MSVLKLKLHKLKESEKDGSLIRKKWFDRTHPWWCLGIEIISQEMFNQLSLVCWMSKEAMDKEVKETRKAIFGQNKTIQKEKLWKGDIYKFKSWKVLKLKGHLSRGVQL
jgi:hypothetical protein